MTMPSIRTPHLSEEDLVLAYYRDLPAAEQAAAEAHLAACESCRAAGRDLVETLGLVDAVAGRRSAAGVRAGDVGAGAGGAARPRRAAWRAWFVPRWAWAAAGAGAGRWRRSWPAAGRGARHGAPTPSADRVRRGVGTGRDDARADPARRRRRSLRSLADGAGRAGQRRPAQSLPRRRAGPAADLVSTNRVIRQSAADAGRTSDGRAARRPGARAVGSGQRRRRETAAELGWCGRESSRGEFCSACG